MANLGDRCAVGSIAPDTGRYKHSVCENTIIVNKGEKLPPCQMGHCPNKGADWILKNKLT